MSSSPSECIAPSSEPDPTETLAGVTIASRAEECRDSMFKSTDFLHKYEDGGTRSAKMRDLIGRFNIWASNMGVFAAFHASLDYRLRDLEEAKVLMLEHLDSMLNLTSRLITLLKDLETPCAPAISITYADNGHQIQPAGHGEIDASLSSLSITIDWLHRLANITRRSGIARQNEKASVFPLKDANGDDATPVLQKLFSYRVMRDFPTISSVSSDLHDRLVSTMLLRRRYILYRRSRQAKLALHTAKAATKPVHITNPTMSIVSGQTTDETKVPTSSIPAVSSIASRQYTATTIDPEVYRRVVSTPSQTHTIALTSDNKDMLPLPPYMVPNSCDFVCPFCCLIIPSWVAENRDEWNAHVKKDLYPYVCLFFPCASHGEDIFGTSAEWIAHMQQVHCMRWKCVAKTHKRAMFEAKDEYIAHMKTMHPGKFAEAQLPCLAEISRRPLKRIFDACPLCGRADIENGQRLQDHIAHHLQYLSILSLPLPDDTDVADHTSSTSKPQSQNEENAAASRTTLMSSSHLILSNPISYQDENPSGTGPPVDEEIPYIEEQDQNDLTSLWESVRMHKLKLQNADQLVSEAVQRRDKVLAGFVIRAESTAFQEVQEKTEAPHGEPCSTLSKETTRPSIGNRVWMVPFEKNPLFTGRNMELEAACTWLFAKDKTGTAKVAITGVGGIGKTRLVIELLHRLRDKDKDCSFLWIPATSEERLSQAYSEAAKRLGIPGCDDKAADVKKLVQDHLSSEGAGQWVIVFDNADDISMWVNKSTGKSGRLIDYLPKSQHGSIIFTTRDKKAALRLAGQNVVEMSEMDEASSKQLLRNYLFDQRLLNSQGDVAALLARLTYLPLAIVQATAFINKNGISLGHYLSLLNGQEEDVISLLSDDFEDETRYFDVENPVATTWLISFERIRQKDSLAADYLSFMACVDVKDIPRSLLPPGPSRKRETDAIGTLLGYSFIATGFMDSPITIHRLVHLATRNWLRKEGLLPSWTDRVIARLVDVLVDVGHENRLAWRTYMPHAYYTLASSLGNDDDENRLKLLRRYGLCLYYDGRYNEAEIIFKRMAETLKTKLGADHFYTLTSISNLASTYRNQGRWKEAEDLELQVMDTRKTKLGVDHPDTLTSISNLASTYRNQGRWEEAEDLELQVMDTRKTKLGVDHPDTLTSISNLASTYRNQGRWEEAEELEVQVMDTRKTKLGVDHPDTLTSTSNLASTYKNQGRWKEAEDLELQVMDTRKTKLGVDHPDTLTSTSNLASTYRNQGRWEEAEELEAEVLKTRTMKLGADHPDTLTSMANLASTYRNQGRWEEAEELEVLVLETCKTKLGADHPDTLSSMANLAFTWKCQGRHTEALALMKDCALARQRRLGPEHPYTVACVATIAEWS